MLHELFVVDQQISIQVSTKGQSADLLFIQTDSWGLNQTLDVFREFEVTIDVAVITLESPEQLNLVKFDH